MNYFLRMMLEFLFFIVSLFFTVDTIPQITCTNYESDREYINVHFISTTTTFNLDDHVFVNIKTNNKNFKILECSVRNPWPGEVSCKIDLNSALYGGFETYTVMKGDKKEMNTTMESGNNNSEEWNDEWEFHNLQKCVSHELIHFQTKMVAEDELHVFWSMQKWDRDIFVYNMNLLVDNKVKKSFDTDSMKSMINQTFKVSDRKNCQQHNICIERQFFDFTTKTQCLKQNTKCSTTKPSPHTLPTPTPPTPTPRHSITSLSFISICTTTSITAAVLVFVVCVIIYKKRRNRNSPKNSLNLIERRIDEQLIVDARPPLPPYRANRTYDQIEVLRGEQNTDPQSSSRITAQNV